MTAFRIFEANVRLDASSPLLFDELVLVSSVANIARSELGDEDGGRRFDINNVTGASFRVLDKACHVGHEILPREVWHQALNRPHDRLVLRASVVPVVRLHCQQVEGGAFYNDWAGNLLLVEKAFAVGVDAQDSE